MPEVKCTTGVPVTPMVNLDEVGAVGSDVD